MKHIFETVDCVFDVFIQLLGTMYLREVCGTVLDYRYGHLEL
jgi:hypothetical protein